eukprot:GHVN01096370.1.p1 GENE.GHVN01096370.1~~GHVN01096370.1.p1  ORF type:complete len:300 (-),score=54.94 GHVN01096370.1:187-1086(-)
MPRSKKPSARVASSTTAEPKLSNTQLKKAARKEMASAQTDKMKKLERAEAVTDVTTLLPDVFKYFKKSDPPIVVEGYAACDVPQTLMEACFALTKGNMQHLYDGAEFNNKGWSDKIKMKELTHDEARFIIAKTETDGELSGFAHFRFEPDEETGEEIMYLYEIQLVSGLRRKGLGRFMMMGLELVARKLEMKKIVCTVLKENPEGSHFFKGKLGFQMDPSSPEYIPAIHGNLDSSRMALACQPQGSKRVLEQLLVDEDEEEDDSRLCEYEILSKTMQPLVVAGSPTPSTSASSASPQSA